MFVNYTLKCRAGSVHLRVSQRPALSAAETELEAIPLSQPVASLSPRLRLYLLGLQGERLVSLQYETRKLDVL